MYQIELNKIEKNEELVLEAYYTYTIQPIAVFLT